VNAIRILVPRMLEQRLLMSYVGAFAVVIAIFAAAVWFSFVTTLNEYTIARLSTLARAGSAAMQFGRDGFVVNEDSFGGFSVHLDSEGLEWFDQGGKLVASRGKTAGSSAPPHKGQAQLASAAGALDTYTITLRDQRGVARGFVRASMLYSGATGPTRALQRGLVAGAVLALLAGALGGALLARSSVARTEESYRRLREFISDASHELRSPLSALAGTASVALREVPDLAQPTRSRLESIGSLTQHMRRLVDDLLILARAERSMEHELFIVDLDALFADVRARHRQIADEREVQLEFVGASGIEIYGNPDQIERIVANLVENALRYTATGGLVTVAWAADAVRLEIAISDNGSGIASGDITRVFDRFWRGDAARAPDRGTGLGLAIALALARRHGGDIVAASELGDGSTFTVTLPRRPPSLH
jgi:signal transduction histidine kinase